MIVGAVALVALFVGIVIVVVTGHFHLTGGGDRPSGPATTRTGSGLVPSGSATLTSPYREGLPYRNCADAARDGRYNIHIGDPACNPALDRNHDGIACERGRR